MMAATLAGSGPTTPQPTDRANQQHIAKMAHFQFELHVHLLGTCKHTRQRSQVHVKNVIPSIINICLESAASPR